VIPDCVTTREPAAPRPSFSILRSLFSVLFASSHVCTPRPRSPSPSSIPAVIARPCPHRSSSPSPSPSPPPHHVNTPAFDTNTPASTLLPVFICAFSNLRDRGLSPSPSLSCHLGNIPELGTQAPFCITVLCRVTDLLPVYTLVNSCLGHDPTILSYAPRGFDEELKR